MVGGCGRVVQTCTQHTLVVGLQLSGPKFNYSATSCCPVCARVVLCRVSQLQDKRRTLEALESRMTSSRADLAAAEERVAAAEAAVTRREGQVAAEAAAAADKAAEAERCEEREGRGVLGGGVHVLQYDGVMSL